MRKGESLYLKILLLIGVELAPQFFVYFGNLEVLPQRSHTEHVIADIDDLHQRVIALSKDPHLTFQGRLASLQLQSAPLGNFLTSTHHQLQIVLLHLSRAKKYGNGQF